MEKNTQPKKIGADELRATVKAGPRKGTSNAEHIVVHIGTHGMSGLLMYETTQDGHVYWLVGQKIEVNKWTVTLLDPNGTYRSAMDTTTDEGFISTLQDVDKHAKAVLIVEAWSIVPITSDNMEFKFRHLTNDIENEKEKNQKNRVAIILAFVAIVGLISGLLPIILGIYIGIGAYYGICFLYKEVRQEMGIGPAILLFPLVIFFYGIGWPFMKPWKQWPFQKIKAKQEEKNNHMDKEASAVTHQPVARFTNTLHGDSKFCGHCGSKHQNDAKFCSACGRLFVVT